MERECFAFREKSHNRCVCEIITPMVCQENKNCAFFLTKADYMKKIKKSEKLSG